MNAPASLTADAAYLASLNPEQRAAVEAVDGPVLVLAGAGTGKTRVLTTRIAHILLGRHAYPSQILAVTFTNKAAREMGERVNRLLLDADLSSQGMWLGTFHSIGAKMLRRHAELLGFTSTFTILDTDDQLRLLKSIVQEMGLDEKKFPPRLYVSIIQGWKDQGLVPAKVGRGDPKINAAPRALDIYTTYQARLKAVNAVDFGDLLLHPLTLFTEHPDILADYAGKFRYILVDEYQDTNVAQYLWLRLLASGHKNLCCVGDDDQSIYGWRGAEVGNILKFEHDFPGATIVRLERNYRSTASILGAASGIIARNKGRLGKTLRAESIHDPDLPKVRVKPVWDDQEEARFIAETIEDCQRRYRASLGEVAILVRAGFQTRAFEERLMAEGIAYRVVGGLRFYERQEIRDALAYIRVLISPNDDLALERIVNVPKRGIGKASLDGLRQQARAKDVSLSRAIRDALPELKGKAGGGLATLMQQFGRWTGLLATLPHPQVVELILEESGYRAMWQQENTPDAQGRLENLKELVRAIADYDDLSQFLEHVSLVTDLDQQQEGEMVSLMTLHAAKGLEFDHVFLPGWEEGLFPHQRALDESGGKGLEEERRLAYVGITRARKTLTITHAANRRIYNQWQTSIPSRFVGELPEEHIEVLSSPGLTRTRIGGSDWQREVASITASVLSSRSPSALQERAAAFAPSSAKFTLGSRVKHEIFGVGTIVGASGDKLDVAFEGGGVKKVIDRFLERA